MKTLSSLMFTIFLLAGTLASEGSAQVGMTLEVDSKSPWKAGIMEGLIPTLGYAHADAWEEGIIPGVLRLGGATVGFWGIAETLSREPGDPDAGTGCTRKCTYGLLAMAVGWVWGVWGAVDAANDWNEAHQPLSLREGAGQVSLGFRFSF